MSFAAEEILFAIDYSLDHGKRALLRSADFAFAQIALHEFGHFTEPLFSYNVYSPEEKMFYVKANLCAILCISQSIW
jgi:hypothetical protein